MHAYQMVSCLENFGERRLPTHSTLHLPSSSMKQRLTFLVPEGGSLDVKKINVTNGVFSLSEPSAFAGVERRFTLSLDELPKTVRRMCSINHISDSFSYDHIYETYTSYTFAGQTDRTTSTCHHLYLDYLLDYMSSSRHEMARKATRSAHRCSGCFRRA